MYDTMMKNTCHYTFDKPIECTTPGVNSNVNYVFRVVEMCQCWFLSLYTCATLGGDVNDRGGWACMGAVGLWKISVASS